VVNDAIEPTCTNLSRKAENEEETELEEIVHIRHSSVILT